MVTGWRAGLRWLNAWELRLHGREGLGGGWLVVAFGLALVAVCSRQPGLLLHAQFYGEDGPAWFGDAYNGGWWHSLTLPDGGYLNTLQRLAGGLALLVPLRWAPLAMTAVGALVQTLPVPVLLSARCRNWAQLRTRLLMVVLYVAIPTAGEIHVVLTNSQWHWAVPALLLGLAAEPCGWRGKAVDVSVLGLMGCSGPFSVLLLPLLLVFWWVRRQRWTPEAAGVLAVGTLVQVGLIAGHLSDRAGGVLGATPQLALRLLAGDVFSCALLGPVGVGRRAPMALIVLLVLGGFLVYGYCVRFAGPALALMICFSVGVLVPELRTPLVSGDRPLWQLLLDATEARYWFFPILTFLWCLAWCALEGRSRSVRNAAAALLLLTSVGIATGWRYVEYPDQDFRGSVRRFNAARVGERVAVPIVPAGTTMYLVKH